MSETRLVGEGQLGWVDSMGGSRVVFPIVFALALIAGLACWNRYEPFALALGALVPLWFAWRMRVPHNVLHVMRRGRPAFRVELDEIGVRTFDGEGKASLETEWFEIERYHVADHGMVLQLRVAKAKGVNAIFVPKSFFTPSEWTELVALVRANLPGAAKAIDDANVVAKVQQAQARRRAIVYGLVMLVVGGGILWVMRDRL